MSDNLQHCTWAGCLLSATRPQISGANVQWANLCEQHDALMKSYAGDVRKMLAAWVKAQGGAAAAARRM